MGGQGHGVFRGASGQLWSPCGAAVLWGPWTLLYPRGGPQGSCARGNVDKPGWGCSWGVQRFGCADTKAIALLMHFSFASGKP